MAGVNKNFVVKNGLEVDTNLILADADNNRVGINTNNMKYTLHVSGGIGATTLYATGISTFNSIHLAGDVTAGSAGVGATGQYLVRVGTGVTWQNLPSTRSSQTFTATTGQTVFLFSYTVGLIDVFINGVKLSPSEYTADDTASVILNTACFGDETVELITYSSVNPGYGYTGIYGISLFEEGSPVGTTGQVVALNFVGAAVTSTATGVAATIYLTENWTKNSQGIFSLNSVGLGTTNPRFALEVGAVGASGTSLWVNGNARVTGILTVGSSSIVLDGANNTINVGSGITINGNTGIVSASNFYANGIQVGVITASTIIYQGATLSPSQSQWVSTAAGIHTLSFVGIGTTNPTSALTVKGNTSLETLNVSGIATFGSASGNSGVVDVVSNSSRTYISPGAITFNNGGVADIQKIDSATIFRGTNQIQLAAYAHIGGFGYKTFFVDSQGPTELYYGYLNKKFETIGAGVTVYGTTFTNQLNVSGVSTFAQPITVTGSQYSIFGNGLIVQGTAVSDLAGNNFAVQLQNGLQVTDGGSVGAYITKSGNIVGTGLTISGTTFTNQLNVSGVSTFSNNVRVSGIVTANSVLISNDGGKNGSVLIEDTGSYSQITFRSSTGTDQTQIQGVEANLYVLPGGTGYIGLADATTNLFYPNGNVILNNGANGTTTLGNGVQITGLTSTTSLRVGTGGTVINATATGSVGIGTTNPTQKLDVSGSVKVGINTSQGVILTSPNGTKYQLFVENDGTLKTIAV